jgi:hypothetical protein
VLLVVGPIHFCPFLGTPRKTHILDRRGGGNVSVFPTSLLSFLFHLRLSACPLICLSYSTFSRREIHPKKDSNYRECYKKEFFQRVLNFSLSSSSFVCVLSWLGSLYRSLAYIALSRSSKSLFRQNLKYFSPSSKFLKLQGERQAEAVLFGIKMK